jgi:dimethylhistidine N-methyltransferase
MIEQFKQDVLEGLSKEEKSLPSKYFYNKLGDELFVEIMHSPEYYLTRSELEIFQKQAHSIIDALNVKQGTYFELIELGAGDGLKTKELLKALNDQAYQFDYFPIDISVNALENLKKTLSHELPDISVKPKHGDYFEVLQSLKDSHHPKVILFLGSNIGNLSDEQAASFIYKLGSNLDTHDKLLLGVDLIKSSSVVLPAYNDKNGITAKFNLNLLQRINDELDADFNLNAFKHQPEYSETDGKAKSYLLSLEDQEVHIGKIDSSFRFKKGEMIFTEISRKYNDDIIKKIIQNTDFHINEKFMDSRSYFADYIFEKR